MKKTIAILLLTVTLLSAFSLPAFADDNAQSGDGTMHEAADGFGWYNYYQYMWKVTVFVGKSDQATKQSNLLNDFYRVGTVIVKRNGWNLSGSAIFGDKIKPDYYGGQSMVLTLNPYAVVEDSNCPLIPIAYGGDIDTVKAYFGSTGTMNTILAVLAGKNGTTPYGLLTGRDFTIGGNSRSGWPEEYLLPNGTDNRLPWVIVYEPLTLIHLKDEITQCAFTATEIALAQMYGWYDWHYSNGQGQAVATLAFKHMPTSVQLEESWFGYPVYNVTDDSAAWELIDMIKGGGWGMRWLNAAVIEADLQTDYGCNFTSVATPKANGYGLVNVTWKNYKPITGTVLCELYRGSVLLWSEEKTFSPGQAVSQSFNVYYPGTASQKLTIRINFENRYSETDPNDNMRTRTVTPTGSGDVDFGAYIMDVESSPDADGYGNIVVRWRNWEEEEGTALCELYRDSVLVWSAMKTFGGSSYDEDEISVFYPGASERTLTARINYEHREDELDPEDNSDSTTVTPVQRYDSTYDFSVSDITVTPNPVLQGKQVTVSFISDNWNTDIGYSNIPLEVLVGGSVVKSENVSFEPYGRNRHSYTITMSGLGDSTVTVRINWEKRQLENRVANNSVSARVKVNPYYEFSVGSVSLSGTVADKGGQITVSFVSDSWDQYNAYTGIPVEVLFNGRTVYSESLDYAAYARKNHRITVNVGTVSGRFPVVVRVNWPDHSNEVNTGNNASDAQYVTVRDSADLSIQAVIPNSAYRAGTDVITSFWIFNSSTGTDVFPEDMNSVAFEAYYYSSGTKKIISSQTWDNAVIPAADRNLVWFKWKVPPELADVTVYCAGTVNADNTVYESTMTNNVSSFHTKVIPFEVFSTPDTQYEREKPSDFSITAAPETDCEYGSWWQYVFEDGEFVRKDYRVSYGVSTISLQPATGPSQESVSGSRNMKSGYGISVMLYGNVRSKAYYSPVTAGMYTDAQYVTAAFPEFGYSLTAGKCRTLEKSGSYWIFRENGEYGNVHFTPLWYPDGDYVVSVRFSDIWTPGGAISATVSTNRIVIAGSAYDDWFVGR